jgi:hypothetical protein
VYLVDDTAWNVYALGTELSPKGDYTVEFAKAWGFQFRGASNWTRDVQKIWSNLNVVDNWDATLYATVKSSNGALGAGGGAPLQPWAPTFDAETSSASTLPGPIVKSLLLWAVSVGL